MAFHKPSDYAGNSFFPAKDHLTDLAIMVEPVSIERNVPSTYKGSTRNRDEVLSDVTIFGNTESLSEGAPTKVYKNTKVVHGMLASTLEKFLGGATVARLEKIPTENGAGFVFRDVDDEIEKQVEKFYEAREAAATEALASVPEF